jgi:adenylate kinase family enzyme
MKPSRIHVTGASGSGVTTIGRALANALALPHHDADDYFWAPTIPPYMVKRPVEDRLRLMSEVFLPRADWVLSGSVDGWGSEINEATRTHIVDFVFDLVVFVSTPTDIRLARLREREARHFGAEAIAESGWRHQEAESFIEWASHYEDGTREGRSRLRHEAWLLTLKCPVIRAAGNRPLEEIVRDVVRFWLSKRR